MGTRLNQQRNKIIFKQTLLAGFFLILFFVGFTIFGFRAIISGAMFFSPDKKNIADESSITKPDIYGIIDISSPFVATNSASLYISGQVRGFDKVTMYLNNDAVGEAEVIEEEFEFELKNLKPGNNEIYAEAEHLSSKNKEKTETVSVEYKNSPPELKIDTPSENSKLTTVDINISGTVDPGTTLKVNNIPFVVSSNGAFSSPFKLKNGENKLSFLAEDRAGNQTSKELMVNVSTDF
jgi:hypothetical protein